MRRFYAPPEDFSAASVALDADETKHLRDVLRLRAGDEIAVFDGTGREFHCSVEIIEKHRALLRIIAEVSAKSPESNLNLTLAVALLKGEKFELVIQKACEIGVIKIIPLETRRADVKLKDSRETAKKLERWRRIALEAAKQSGRARLTIVESPVKFESFIETAAESATKILFTERAGKSLEDLDIAANAEMLAIVGAEGGWEDSEIDAARGKRFQIVTLGGRILRAETAAIVVSAILQNHYGDLR